VYEDPGEPLGRGTKIVLTLKEDALEFLEEERLKGLIRRYSEVGLLTGGGVRGGGGLGNGDRTGVACWQEG
jgi:hypothetical protein